MSETSRPVAQVVKPEPVVEGAGVHLRRSIGTRRLAHLDPSLLPDHCDSVRHHGSIGPGDIQWMTSGSGILHEEMPQVRPEGIGGLQLWLNLPAREKMTRPKYRDLEAAALPETATDEGARVRVIAGESAGVSGPVEG